eukprot:1649624-Amphidinium_carterae.7
MVCPCRCTPVVANVHSFGEYFGFIWSGLLGRAPADFRPCAAWFVALLTWVLAGRLAFVDVWRGLSKPSSLGFGPFELRFQLVPSSDDMI